jgi:hypothetical protein
MANHSDLQEEIWYNRFPRPLPGAASQIGMQHKNVFKHFYGILVSTALRAADAAFPRSDPPQNRSGCIKTGAVFVFR